MSLKIGDFAKPETIIVSAALSLAWNYLLPAVGTITGAVLRPATKTVIKGGMAAQGWAAQMAAGAKDITAEAAQEARGATYRPSNYGTEATGTDSDGEKAAWNKVRDRDVT